MNLLEQVQRVPIVWAHKHTPEDGEWDPEFFDVCEMCRVNFQAAVEKRTACEKHPDSYVDEETGCEGCNEISR